MKKAKANSQMRATAIKVGICYFFIGFALVITDNYTAYAWTDLNGLSPALYGSCMSVLAAVATVLSCLSGIVVQRTRSRWGQNRPWIFVLSILCMAGALLTFSGWGGSTFGKAAVLCVAYFFTYATTDMITVAATGLNGQMARGDSDAQTMIINYRWIGTNAALLVAASMVLTMVNILGKGNEIRGFLLTEVIVAVLVIGGYMALIRMGKEVDLPNNKTGVAAKRAEQTKASILDMIKGVVMNRAALCVILSDLCRWTGGFIFFTMMVYHCKYVLGDINYMTLGGLATGIACIVGNVLSGIVAKRFHGRKKTVFIFGACEVLVGLFLALFAKTLAGYLAGLVLYYLADAGINGVNFGLYIDAGEYYLHETGKDVRSFILGCYGMGIKLCTSISAVIFGVLMSAMHYQEGMAFSEAQATTFTWMFGLAVAIGYGLPLIIMQFHPVSDSKIAEILRENAEANRTAEEAAAE